MYINGILPLVVDKVQATVQAEGQGNIEQLSGQGDMAEVNYIWSATLTEYRPAPPQVLAESSAMITQANRFKRWQVTLNLVYKQHEREFRYVEFSWDEMSTR